MTVWEGRATFSSVPFSLSMQPACSIRGRRHPDSDSQEEISLIVFELKERRYRFLKTKSLPAMPNTVWKTSHISPGLSAIPPSSGS